MIELYTETLQTLLKNKNYGEESEDSSLTEILELMDKFPTFVFNSTSINFTFNMKDLFMECYELREIGAETEELFLFYWRKFTNAMLIKYAPKIQMWLDNFNDLFKFTVKLTIADSETSSNDNTNTYYLNPINGNTTNLKVQDVDNSKEEYSKGRIITRDVLQTVWGKTRANILNQIMELENIYLECLYDFENIFMVVM